MWDLYSRTDYVKLGNLHILIYTDRVFYKLDIRVDDIHWEKAPAAPVKKCCSEMKLPMY